MPNIASVLKEEICRLARKEINAQTAVLRRQSAQHRRDIASLKRTIDQQEKRIAFLERQEKKRGVPVARPSAAAGARFSAKGLRSHRERLGLSAEDYGRLLGVTGQSVYAWEQERTRPRQAQLARIVEVRGMGKREAEHRLSQLAAS